MKRFQILFLLLFISVAGLKSQTTLQQCLDELNADSLQANAQWLQDMPSRFSLSDNHRDVAVSIQNRFIQLGYTNASLDSFYITNGFRGQSFSTWQYNVVAVLPGTETADSACIVGAHYDATLSSINPLSTKAPGANDNASGVSTIIELARVMKKLNLKPKNSVEFVAFAIEELGLWGSKDYVSKAKAASKKIKMMINLDMVAYETNADKANWKVNIVNYYNSGDLFANVQENTNRYSILGHVNNNSVYQLSDSYPFSLGGFPAVFLICNDGDVNYHTVNDVVANCNFDYCLEIAKITGATLLANNLDTGLEDLDDINIRIYPNPANNILYLKGFETPVSVSVIDLNGKIMLSEILSDNQINISALPNGPYTIQLSTNTKTITRKFLKQSK
jgi:hypothetical protein